MSNSIPGNPNVIVQPETKAASIAYAKVEPEFTKLLPEQLIRVSLDITKAASMAIGAIPAITSFRADILSAVPQFPIEKLDRLEEYALAAFYAHILSLPPGSDGSPAAPLLEEAGPLRETLLFAAQALAKKGYFEEGRVADIRSGTGHFDTSNDLASLARLYREKWSVVEHRTAVEKAEVDRADTLSTELVVALGARLQPNGEPVTVGQAAENRTRAFTLFMNAYDTCRKAISFLRWDQGDAEQIAPSLFVRTRGRKAQDSSEPEPPAAPAPAPSPAAPSPAAPNA